MLIANQNVAMQANNITYKSEKGVFQHYFKLGFNLAEINLLCLAFYVNVSIIIKLERSKSSPARSLIMRAIKLNITGILSNIIWSTSDLRFPTSWPLWFPVCELKSFMTAMPIHVNTMTLIVITYRTFEKIVLEHNTDWSETKTLNIGRAIEYSAYLLASPAFFLFKNLQDQTTKRTSCFTIMKGFTEAIQFGYLTIRLAIDWLLLVTILGLLAQKIYSKIGSFRQRVLPIRQRSADEIDRSDLNYSFMADIEKEYADMATQQGTINGVTLSWLASKTLFKFIKVVAILTIVRVPPKLHMFSLTFVPQFLDMFYIQSAVVIWKILEFFAHYALCNWTRIN